MPAYYYFALQGNAQRFALPALGWGRRSRPTRKMKRRGKLLEIAAESPASGARFVSLRLGLKTPIFYPIAYLVNHKC